MAEEQEGRWDETPDAEDVDLQTPPGDPKAKQPSQADVLGLLDGKHGTSPLDALFKVDDKVEHWAPRGKRTQKVKTAILSIMQENRALTSQSFPLQGDHMKRVMDPRAYREMFSHGKEGMQKLEFAGLIFFGAFIMLVLFLVSTIYSE